MGRVWDFIEAFSAGPTKWSYKWRQLFLYTLPVSGPAYIIVMTLLTLIVGLACVLLAIGSWFIALVRKD